jgi:hypothetical protein
MRHFKLMIARLAYYGGASPTKAVLGKTHDPSYAMVDLPIGLSVGHYPTMPRDVDAKVFAEDCKLLLEENVTYGLRSEWLRRVAVPVIMAYRHINVAPATRERFAEAKEIISQCADVNWREYCTDDVEQAEINHANKPD